jgi:hypothetical protein
VYYPGSYLIEFSHYDMVPGNVQQEIIAKAQMKEEEEGQGWITVKESPSPIPNPTPLSDGVARDCKPNEQG